MQCWISGMTLCLRSSASKSVCFYVYVYTWSYGYNHRLRKSYIKREKENKTYIGGPSSRLTLLLSSEVNIKKGRPGQQTLPLQPDPARNRCHILRHHIAVTAEIRLYISSFAIYIGCFTHTHQRTRTHTDTHLRHLGSCESSKASRGSRVTFHWSQGL